LYSSVGGRSRSGGRRPSAGSYQRQLTVSPAAAAKAEEAQRLARLFQELLSVHREEFPRAERPIVPPPADPDVAEIRRRHRKAALAGLGWFKRAARADARERAARTAEEEIQRLRAEGARQRGELQAELDIRWRALRANDPDTVMSALAAAFEDNEAAAAPLGVDRNEVALVVLAPAESIVPERMPGTTAAGNLSLRTLPKGERAAFYTMAVMGHVVVTVKEAFAVAPGLHSARVIALRPGGTDAYGRPRLESVLAGQWQRSAFDGVQWATADAATVAQDTASELLIKLRGGKELQPLDLSDQPGIRALLQIVDVAELTA
jgi:type II secretory pathway pseudopilin PulG